MATAQSVIKKALQRILVQGSEADLEPDEYADAISALNDMMFAYEADGISLGYTVVSNVADQITVPAGAIRGIVSNLAIELAPDYDRPIPPALAESAAKGEEAMRKLALSIVETTYPARLPRGSGNEGDVATFGRHFYEDQEESIEETYGLLTLTSLFARTTIAASDTPVLMEGTWSVDDTENMTGTTGGRLTYDGDDTVNMNVTVSIAAAPATGTWSIAAHIAKNGSVIPGASMEVYARAPYYENITIPWIVEMEEDDYIEIFLENISTAVDILVKDGIIRATL